MKSQTFRVFSVIATDPDAGEHDVVLESGSGLKLRAVLEGTAPSPNETIEVDELYFIDEGGDWTGDDTVSDFFEQHPSGAFRAAGRTVALSNGDAIVDCHGVAFRVSNVGHDPSLVGTRLKFSGHQIDVERASAS